MLEAFHRSAHFILQRRRVGKIAALPHHIREQINLMLLDNLPYATIIHRLGEAGQHLNKDNLSRWRKAEHQDWLAEQTWRQAASRQAEPSPQVQHVATLLHELDADSMQNTVARRPDKFVPLMNLMARLVHLSAEDGSHRPQSAPISSYLHLFADKVPSFQKPDPFLAPTIYSSH
jgi:hypothetical protein